MPSLNSDNSVQVKISTDADTRGVDEASRSLSNFGDGSTKLGGILASGLRTGALAAAAALVAVGAATLAAGIAGIKGAADFEQNRVAFDTMLGSGAKAKTLMEEIAKFAQATPFELPEVVSAAKSLTAFGISSTEVIPTLRRLGDVSAGIGANVGEIAEIYGKAKVQGRLFAEDVNQLTGRGIPIFQALASVMGVTQDKVRGLVADGKIGFPELEKAFIEITKEGSQFGGMMDKQSKTFNGVVSNLKDGFGAMLRSAVGVSNAGEVVKGGLFDVVKGAAEGAIPKLKSFGEALGPMLTSTVQSSVSGITQFAQVLKGEGYTSVGGFTGFMQKLAAIVLVCQDAVVKYLGPSFNNLMVMVRTSLMPTLALLKPYLDDIARILGAVLIAAIWVAINALSAIIGIIQVFVRTALWWKDIIVSVVGTVGYYLGVAINLFRNVPGGIAAAFGGLASIIMWPFQAAFNFISGIPGRIAGLFSGIGGMIKNVIGGIKLPGPLGLVRNLIPGFATGVRNFSGGMAVVGEQGPELVNLPGGSDVFTNRDSSRMMSGSSNSTTYNIAKVELSSSAAVKEFFAIQDRNGLLASKGMSMVRV